MLEIFTWNSTFKSVFLKLFKDNMKYKLLNESYEKTLIERLLEIRQIASDADAFFEPTLNHTWIDPFKIEWMDKAVKHIMDSMKKKEKIMIFGDYDVDWITASYCLYKFFRYFLQYSNVSIMYPNRQKDWYGLRNYHLDEMKSKWVQLVITVDNWITSIDEAKYAKEIWIDLLITDHHQPLNELPDAVAVLNQNCSPDYAFKWLAGVGVAFKLIVAMLSKCTNLTSERKNQIFNYFLPIVAIWTVADVVPLLWENRFIVKRWLELMNRHPDSLPKCLQWFLSYLNIKSSIDTYHIGFVIWPRINAWWRIQSPYDSLNVFLHDGDEQIEFLQKMDAINQERKRLQEEWLKVAEKLIDVESPILIAESEDFHEWVIGIIAGRLTEKYNKPSIVFKSDKEKWTASASLRGPDYFSVIDMLKDNADVLERFWWHKWAGWLTVKLKNLDKLNKKLTSYCKKKIKESDLEKVLFVDTKILPQEWTSWNFAFLEKFEPFGECNEEPLFLFENLQIQKVEKVWKNGSAHMKLYAHRWNQLLHLLFRWKGSQSDLISDEISVIWKIRRDTFNWGYFVDGCAVIEDGKIIDI